MHQCIFLPANGNRTTNGAIGNTPGAASLDHWYWAAAQTAASDGQIAGFTGATGTTQVHPANHVNKLSAYPVRCVQ